MSNQPPVKILLAGCGAVATLYYLPVLKEMHARAEIEVAGFFDPDPGQHALFKTAFPMARAAGAWSELLETPASLAIVASPQKFHATQTVELLEHGCGVLCEKPMAATVAEADAMIAASARTGKPLAVGLFRRFFPSSQTIRETIRGGALGRVKHFEISEGSPFNWPAHSASFFQKSGSAGGVLADLGIHLVDLLLWWFGEPLQLSYADDAMGGLEANCLLEMEFPGDVSGTVRLSRDTLLLNRTVLEFERGWIRCKAASAAELEIGLAGVPFACEGALVNPGSGGPHGFSREPAPTYTQSFATQLQNVIGAIRGEAQLLIPGTEAIRSLRFIEECYRQRGQMPMRWLDGHEVARAKILGAPASNR